MAHVGVASPELGNTQVTCPYGVDLLAFSSLHYLYLIIIHCIIHIMVGEAKGSGSKALSVRRTRIVASHHYDPRKLHDISIKSGRISGIIEHTASTDTQGFNEPMPIDAYIRLVTPSLCHAHMHLDKAFLTSDPKYADLQLEKGGFVEAMEIGTKAKRRFEMEDLLKRGKWYYFPECSPEVGRGKRLLTQEGP